MADLKYTFEIDVSQALSNARNLTELFKQISERLTSLGTREAVTATEAIDKFVLAFEKLKPEEIEKLSPAIEKAVKEFSKLEQVKLGDIKNFVENLRNSLQQLPQANTQIITSLELISSRMRDLAVHSGSARMVMTSLNYVIRDLPWGFIGISNNIDMLAQGFIELSKQTGGAVGALRALGSALIGPTGITFLVSAGVSALTTYFMTHRKSVQDTILTYDELIKKIEELRKETEGMPISGSKFTSEWKKISEDAGNTLRELLKQREKIEIELKRLEATAGGISPEITEARRLRKEQLIKDLEELNVKINKIKEQIVLGPFPELTDRIFKIIEISQKFGLENVEKFIGELNRQIKGLSISDLELTLDLLNEKRKVLDINSEAFKKNARAIQLIQEALKQFDEQLKKTGKIEDIFKIERERFDLFEKMFKVGSLSLDEFKAKAEGFLKTLEQLKQKTKDEKLRIEIETVIVETRGKISEAELQPIKEQIENIKDRISKLKVDFRLKLIDENTFRQTLEKEREDLNKILREQGDKLNEELKRQIADIIFTIEQELNVNLFEQKLKDFETRIKKIELEFSLGKINWETAKKQLQLVNDDFLKWLNENYQRMGDEAKVQALKFQEDLNEKLSVNLDIKRKVDEAQKRIAILTLQLGLEVDPVKREQLIQELKKLRDFLENLLMIQPQIDLKQQEDILSQIRKIDSAIESINKKTEKEQKEQLKLVQTIFQPFETSVDHMISYWLSRWNSGLEQARSDWERFLKILEMEFLKTIAKMAFEAIISNLLGAFSISPTQTGTLVSDSANWAKINNLNVPAIAGANLNIIVPSGQNQQLERILTRLQNLETKINISVNNQINQHIDTDWIKIRTGINTANYRKFSKTL